MGRVFFFIGEGLRALRRSAAPSLAAIVTVCITALLLGVLIPVLAATFEKTNEVRDQVGLRVFLNDVNGQQAPPNQIAALDARLKAIPHVQEVEFVDKNEALGILSDRLKDENREDITAQLPGAHNPLPASFNVTPDDLSNLGSVRAAITPPGATGQPTPISPLISDIGDSRDDASKISGATTAIRWVLGVVSGMLLFASLLLVGNTIRLSIYARRREVEVMRLVGATNWFIRWPFMVEGLVVGFVGGVIAVGVLLACAMAVSALGSGLTLRRFMRV